jgi:hypothetical protein
MYGSGQPYLSITRTQVIMLVESADGQRALLGRSAASPAGMGLIGKCACFWTGGCGNAESAFGVSSEQQTRWLADGV